MEEQLHGFNRRDTQNILALLDSGARVLLPPPQQSQVGEVLIGKVIDAAIPAGGTAPGSGMVDIQRADPDTGALSSAGFQVRGWNFAGIGIPINTVILLGCEFMGGNWVIINFKFVRDVRWLAAELKLQKTFDGTTWIDVVEGDADCPET